MSDYLVLKLKGRYADLVREVAEHYELGPTEAARHIIIEYAKAQEIGSYASAKTQLARQRAAHKQSAPEREAERERKKAEAKQAKEDEAKLKRIKKNLLEEVYTYSRVYADAGLTTTMISECKNLSDMKHIREFYYAITMKAIKEGTDPKTNPYWGQILAITGGEVSVKREASTSTNDSSQIEDGWVLPDIDIDAEIKRLNDL